MTGASTVLLTLGRLPKALDLARGFKAAGCRVIVAEPFGLQLCRPSRAVDLSLRTPAPNEDLAGYHAALLRIVEEEKVDLIIPVSEEGLNVIPIKPRLPDGVRLFSEDFGVVEALHDKQSFIETAKSFGLTVPQTCRLGSEAGVALWQGGETVVKMINSCSATGLQFCHPGAPLPDAASLPPAVVQQKVEGRHISSFTLAERGQARVTSIYQGTVFSGHVAVAFERLEHESAIERWIDVFLEKSGYSGFISFDFILDKDGQAFAIECNPRVTSGVHFLNARDLALAILNPGGRQAISFKSQRHMQQLFPCLTEVQATVFKKDSARRKLKWLLKSRDVTWDKADPWPLILMTPMSWPILKRTIFKGESFEKASMRDIAWFGDER